MFTRAIRIALPVVLVAALLTSPTGHGQAQLMTEQQPMKMAAAEALYTTPKPRAVLAVRRRPVRAHARRAPRSTSTIPDGLSILATNSLERQGRGHQRPRTRQYRAKYGPGDYAPIIGVTYWTFRIMTGIGFA